MSCTPPEELVGYGTLLQYQNPLNDEWVTVAGTLELESPEDTDDGEVEATPDPDTGYKRFIPAKLSVLNEVSYEMNFRRSVAAIMKEFRRTKRMLPWRLVVMTPEQDYTQFCAYVKGYQEMYPEGNELITSTITLRPSGGPSYGTLN